jgi:hypothetical protein
VARRHVVHRQCGDPLVHARILRSGAAPREARSIELPQAPKHERANDAYAPRGA